MQAATYNTAVYKTTKSGYECCLFTQSPPYQPLAPEETFFSDSLEELRTRFARPDESQLNTIGLDLPQENKVLTKFLEKAQLNIHGVLCNQLLCTQSKALANVHSQNALFTRGSQRI